MPQSPYPIKLLISRRPWARFHLLFTDNFALSWAAFCFPSWCYLSYFFHFLTFFQLTNCPLFCPFIKFVLFDSFYSFLFLLLLVLLSVSFSFPFTLFSVFIQAFLLIHNSSVGCSFISLNKDLPFIHTCKYIFSYLLYLFPSLTLFFYVLSRNRGSSVSTTLLSWQPLVTFIPLQDSLLPFRHIFTQADQVSSVRLPSICHRCIDISFVIFSFVLFLNILSLLSSRFFHSFFVYYIYSFFHLV